MRYADNIIFRAFETARKQSRETIRITGNIFIPSLALPLDIIAIMKEENNEVTVMQETAK